VADSKEFWPITEGEWVKYQQENQGGHYDEGGYYNEDGDWVEYMDEELYNQDNDDAMVQKDLNSPSQATLLTKSLQGKGTGWCTAGVNTATAQLENGDFYVYYSKDKLGVPSVPRLAIRMEGGQIAEVRGVAQNQNIDPYIAPVLEEKMSEFGERGEIYKKKAEDMRRLTDIDSRHKSGEDLSQNDLYFLYQVYESIEGFGYGEDTRIAEITSQRDWKQDMSVMYESSSDLDLAFKLIDSGKDALVIHKLDMFQVGDHNEIAMKILDDVGVLAFTGPDSEGGTRDFKKFQGLSADVAQRFFKSGMGSLVVDNLKSFRGLTSEMALQIMPTADGRDPGRRLVVSNLQSFEKLNREVAERLIGRGRGFKDVVEHIEVFDVDHNDVALAFLNGGSRPLGYRNLFGKLSGLSTEVALKFIAKGDKRMVSWNLQNFGSLDREILSKLNLSEEAIQEYLNRQTVQ
jgi:hypothetical protein